MCDDIYRAKPFTLVTMLMVSFQKIERHRLSDVDERSLRSTNATHEFRLNPCLRVGQPDSRPLISNPVRFSVEQSLWVFIMFLAFLFSIYKTSHNMKEI